MFKYQNWAVAAAVAAMLSSTAYAQEPDTETVSGVESSSATTDDIGGADRSPASMSEHDWELAAEIAKDLGKAAVEGVEDSPLGAAARILLDSEPTAPPELDEPLNPNYMGPQAAPPPDPEDTTSDDQSNAVPTESDESSDRQPADVDVADSGTEETSGGPEPSNGDASGGEGEADAGAADVGGSDAGGSDGGGADGGGAGGSGSDADGAGSPDG